MMVAVGGAGGTDYDCGWSRNPNPSPNITLTLTLVLSLGFYGQYVVGMVGGMVMDLVIHNWVCTYREYLQGVPIGVPGQRR